MADRTIRFKGDDYKIVYNEKTYFITGATANRDELVEILQEYYKRIPPTADKPAEMIFFKQNTKRWFETLDSLKTEVLGVEGILFK